MCSSTLQRPRPTAETQAKTKSTNKRHLFPPLRISVTLHAPTSPTRPLLVGMAVGRQAVNHEQRQISHQNSSLLLRLLLVVETVKTLPRNWLQTTSRLIAHCCCDTVWCWRSAGYPTRTLQTQGPPAKRYAVCVRALETPL